MHYLPELKAINDHWNRENAAKKAKSEGLYKDDYIIVVHTPGKPKSFFSRSGYYQTQQATVKGWRDDEFDAVRERVEQLEKTVAHNVKLSIQRRGITFALNSF